VNATNHSSEAHAVRLRTKYNAAVLRSRRLQKKIGEQQSSMSLPAESQAMISHRVTAVDLHAVGAATYQRLASPQDSESACVRVTVPSDCRHLRPRSDKILTETHVCHNFGQSQHHVSPHMNSTNRTEACRTTLAKHRTRMNNTGGTVLSAVGISPSSGMPKRSPPAYGNKPDIMKYATLPGKNGQQKPTHQCQPEVGDKHQQLFHSGISHTSGNSHASRDVAWSTCDHRYSEMSRATRRHDEMVLPLYNSLPRPKISW